jgi:hypothetical protein
MRNNSTETTTLAPKQQTAFQLACQTAFEEMEPMIAGLIERHGGVVAWP